MQYLYGLIFIFFSLPTLSGTFYVSPELGKRTVSIDGTYTIDKQNQDPNGIVIGLTSGYEFDSNFFIEAGADSSFQFNFFDVFDEISFSEARLLVGYELHLHDFFSISPKIGINKWSLREKEGQFLNPGPEEEQIMRGRDNTWEISLNFAASSLKPLTLSYNKSNYIFGKVATTRLGFKFRFNM